MSDVHIDPQRQFPSLNQSEALSPARAAAGGVCLVSMPAVLDFGCVRPPDGEHTPL